MTDTEIEELEAELRLHKEERLRLRALEMRLSRELAEARELLAEAQQATRCGCYVDCPPDDGLTFYQRLDAALAGGDK